METATGVALRLLVIDSGRGGRLGS